MVVQVPSSAEAQDLRNCFVRSDSGAINLAVTQGASLATIRVSPPPDPADPFRMSQLVELVRDRNPIVLRRTGLDDPMPAHELWQNGQRVQSVPHALFRSTDPNPQDVSGQTIAGHFAAGRPHFSGFVTTAPATSVLYRDIRGFQALAHELFGHAYLLHTGAAYRHGEQISSTRSPFDNIPFSGPVNEFILRIIGTAASPTVAVSTRITQESLAAVEAVFTAGGGPYTNFRAMPAFLNAWERLSRNFSMLQVLGPRATAAGLTGASAAGGATGADYILGRLRALYGRLSGTRANEFRTFVHRFPLNGSEIDPSGLLANALSQALAQGRPAIPQPDGTNPLTPPPRPSSAPPAQSSSANAGG